MGIQSQKTDVAAFLKNRDQPALLEWAKSVRNPFRMLMSMTYDRDKLVRWRAIEATGWVVATYAESDLGRVRDMLRRLFWQMNDESGGLACCALALGALKAKSHRADIERLLDDQSPVSYYDFGCGNIVSKLVSELAKEALNMVDTRESAA